MRSVSTVLNPCCAVYPCRTYWCGVEASLRAHSAVQLYPVSGERCRGGRPSLHRMSGDGASSSLYCMFFPSFFHIYIFPFIYFFRGPESGAHGAAAGGRATFLDIPQSDIDKLTTVSNLSIRRNSQEVCRALYAPAHSHVAGREQSHRRPDEEQEEEKERKRRNGGGALCSARPRQRKK